MSEIHMLNVGEGDCTIFKSNKGRITMIDICNGNAERAAAKRTVDSAKFSETLAIRGNFQMCQKPTNPLDFLDKMGITSIFRFILTHPDMDHLDGFNNLLDGYNVLNYWDSGVRKEKPDFNGSTKYKEADWDRYAKVINKKESLTVITPKAGSTGKYYNSDDDDSGGDYISILAPSEELVNETNEGGDVNDGSYVVVYNTAGGKVAVPGDAHDKAWAYVIENHLDRIKGCAFMLAPHHGRDSGRSWDFLDKIQPKISLLGCAASEHLAYGAWDNRDLTKVTQNQTGNIALYPDSKGIDMYIENKAFAEKIEGSDINQTDSYGNYYIGKINTEETSS
jgi:competence protein ComEC